MGDAAGQVPSLDINIAGVQTIVHFSAPEWIELDLERAATLSSRDQRTLHDAIGASNSQAMAGMSKFSYSQRL